MKKMALALFVVAVLMASRPGLSEASDASSAPATPVAAASLSVLEIPSTLFGTLQQDQGDWQRRYDAAQSRRSSGKKKIWLGLALDGAGVATVFLAANDCLNDIYSDCTGSGAAATIGALTAAAGGGTFLWGLIQYIGANGEVSSLEATRPAGRTSGPTFPLTEHHGIQVSAGARTSAAYSLRW